MTDQEVYHYCDQLFMNVADETNVKRIVITLPNFEPKVEVVYTFDTINGKSKGFTVERDGKVVVAPKTLMITLRAWIQQHP